MLVSFGEMDNTMFYVLANYFFFGFHIALICFNLFGWIPKRTRKWNLLSLGLTAFSWVILGIFYGLGYCFLTDWHWQVREKLGYTTESNSYIHFLVTELFNIKVKENLVDTLTAIFFISAIVLSIFFNFFAKSRKN
jgi:hypothetical protein